MKYIDFEMEFTFSISRSAKPIFSLNNTLYVSRDRTPLKDSNEIHPLDEKRDPFNNAKDKAETLTL